MTAQFQPACRFLALPGFLLALTVLATGCVTNQPWLGGHEEAPIPAQLMVLWDARVHEAQDVVNGGQALPGLAGRLYLMNPENIPEKGNGSLSIDLYDMSHGQPGPQAVALERWEWDAGTLAKLLRRDDKLGWGYTMFLPWSTIRPDITRVLLKVCYTPAKGGPIYAQPAPISIINENAPANPAWPRNQISTTQSQKSFAPNGQAITAKQ